MAKVAQLKTQSVDRMHVRLEHLDTLLGLAGEVIITSANLQELERRAQTALARHEPFPEECLNAIKTSNEASHRISQDLHDLVMAIRLVEIGDTLRLLRRPVRDLSRNLGRDVELIFEGSDTMIDKALAERLVDPLLHMLRNAVDHGIEPPIERTRGGKPSQGKIIISAVDREHATQICISDDGRGIDETTVLETAWDSNHLTRGSRAPLLDLLCRPGFSMATSVSATSGRGVGLDLVRSVVEEFDGKIELETEPGKGTTFKLMIPKLRAVNIVDALTLRAGNGLFALPIEQVVASLGIVPAQIQTAMDQGKYFTYQGQVIVLHDLRELLGSEPLPRDAEQLSVVIVQSRSDRIGLVISEFLGPQKLVNIPFDESLPHDPGVAGTSVFTGGRLGLTLDINELVARALGTNRLPASTSASDQGFLGIGAAGDAGTTVGPSDALEPCRADCPEIQKTVRGQGPSGLSSGASRFDEADVSGLIDELRSGLQKLQDALLSLEASPQETDLLNEAFRRLHAAKGNLTMLAAEAAADLAHHLETMLDFLRADRLEVTPERMDLMLDCVSYLSSTANAFPNPISPPPPELVEKLHSETKTGTKSDPAENQVELIGRTFELSPTLQLQVLSALKRGEHTFETYLTFDSGRQAPFLVAYLILRRLGLYGSILASLPSVAEIEKGKCGTAIKVLWSTPLDEAGVNETLEALSTHHNLIEYSSIPTTIFRYE
ncbi:MAG: chemotaxis protein CheW [Candidatus Eisenbacteria sp.]|nr:chemotaxis protein CheW [Candidatus Eisenbacteria bacterium]